MTTRRRGVAQLELVAGMPLLLVMFGLTLLAAAFMTSSVSRMSARDGSESRPAAARGRPVPDSGPEEECDEVRAPLQVPVRFRVLSDGGAAVRLRPIAALGRWTGVDRDAGAANAGQPPKEKP
jgi:hypothetical protein